MMDPNETQDANEKLSDILEQNLFNIKREIGNSFDIKTRTFQKRLSDGSMLHAGVVYTEGISALQSKISDLFSETETAGSLCLQPSECMDAMKQSILTDANIIDIFSLGELFHYLLAGYCIVMLDGTHRALAVDTVDVKARPVEEPSVQSVVRGPREGFSEVLSWNTAMLRRKIKSRNLWMESRVVGRETQTTIVVAYVKGIVNDDVLEKVRKRLDRIDIDAILESNYIEEFIQDKQLTSFPTVFNSERPDVVAAQLLEGKVAILVDGTPFALVVPALFVQFFQSPEDYYQRADFATLIRILRFISFHLTMLTPSIYIALTTFQQELLPTTLIFNLASQREGVPFPAFLEALIMEVTFEILREASVRMPKTVGQSISIVGTLVIGQAAVDAGLVTAGMVIVVSITAISNFVMPAFNMGIAARILRFGLMALGATFGLFGVFLGIILITVRLCNLKSFGVPYMSPMAPIHFKDQKDSLFRVPLPWMQLRPGSMKTKNRVRQKHYADGPESES
ncbi:spore germination protein [Paenibacillus sepulcri]